MSYADRLRAAKEFYQTHPNITWAQVAIYFDLDEHAK